MAIRLAAALSRITSLEKRNRELIQEIAALRKELTEVNKEKKLLSRKTTVGNVSVKDTFRDED